MNMKKFFVAFLAMLTYVSVMAQRVDLPIAVAGQRSQMTDDEGTLQLLKNKLSASMTEAGFGMANYSGIIVSPNTTITNMNVVEGGMRKIFIYDINLSLDVSQVITGTVFYSVNLSLRGEGYTKEAAIMASIRNIDDKDKRLSSFFSEARKRIFNYYENNTQNIITKARTLSGVQQYDEALALLASYPETLPKYKLVATATMEIYAQYQKKACRDIIQKANGAYAVGNYDEAVQWLNEVDMSSPCANDASVLTSNIKKSITTEQAQAIALYEKQMKSEESIEKQRLKTIENIAIGYYKNQPDYYYVF